MCCRLFKYTTPETFYWLHKENIAASDWTKLKEPPHWLVRFFNDKGLMLAFKAYALKIYETFLFASNASRCMKSKVKLYRLKLKLEQLSSVKF